MIANEVRVNIQIDHDRLQNKIDIKNFVLNLKYIKGLSEDLNGNTTIAFTTDSIDHIISLPILNSYQSIADLICD